MAEEPFVRGRQRDSHARLRPPLAVPHTHVHTRLRRTLELAQDIVVVGLCALLLVLMLRMLWRLIQLAIEETVPPTELLSQVVLILILIELYRSLIYYLRKHRIDVSLMVEVTIVSVLRELILEGLSRLGWPQALGTSVLLGVLGGLLVLDRWMHWQEEEHESEERHGRKREIRSRVRGSREQLAVPLEGGEDGESSRD